jgi:hypothetical protein
MLPHPFALVMSLGRVDRTPTTATREHLQTERWIDRDRKR